MPTPASSLSPVPGLRGAPARSRGLPPWGTAVAGAGALSAEPLAAAKPTAELIRKRSRRSRRPAFEVGPLWADWQEPAFELAARLPGELPALPAAPPAAGPWRTPHSRPLPGRPPTPPHPGLTDSPQQAWVGQPSLTCRPLPSPRAQAADVGAGPQPPRAPLPSAFFPLSSKFTFKKLKRIYLRGKFYGTLQMENQPPSP